MAAIISDNLKITNCTNFVNNISTEPYYTFIGLPNSEDYNSDWNTNTPSPIDNKLYHNCYKNSILSVKKITSSDVTRVIPKIKWESGLKYDMYRHDYSSYNPTKISSTSKLYDSKYYIVNKDYNVYVCLYNGSSYQNVNGLKSLYEPTNTASSAQEEPDGYIWKYLYTISASELLQFDSNNYIPVPNNWAGRIKSAAVDGKIEVILIEQGTQYNVGSQLVYNDVPISGDGYGGLARVEFNEEAFPIKVTVTAGGDRYTYATLNLDSIVSPIENSSIFNVIIPPDGGHGFDVYQELGAFRILLYSRIENSDITNPDFGNQYKYARIGIIKNIKSYGSSAKFTASSGTATRSIKLNEIFEGAINSKITQGTAIGKVIEIIDVNQTSSVIKYIIVREDYIDTYSSGNITQTGDPFYTIPDYNNKSITKLSYGGGEILFNNNSQINNAERSYTVDSNFSGTNLGELYFGQTFSGGISTPDININSGQLIYIENRSPVTRQQNQREDIKIVIEF